MVGVGGGGPSRGNAAQMEDLPGPVPLKAFQRISVTPTYNSGIEQYSNYTKHPGAMEGGGREGGGLTNVEK